MSLPRLTLSALGAYMLISSLSATSVIAADATTGLITAAGNYHPLPKAAYQPSKNANYKVVFALTKGPEKPGEVNPGIERVARTVNLYVAAGVPVGHLKFVAVASGGATPLALDDAHYQAKFGVNNPNLAVIRQLKAAGVDVAVCGQALLESQFQTDWVAPDVTLALSALTTVTTLQQQGYALMPL